MPERLRKRRNGSWTMWRKRHTRLRSFSTTPAVVPEEEKLRSGLQPGGSRLSLGLEDWHDRIADLQDALEVV